jgi:hypothetical protein
MKNTLALSILKVEGIGEQSGCYIIVDDQLIDAISIQYTQINENCVEIPLKGVLKLVVKSLNTIETIECSIRIAIDALPSEGTVWLPLYSNSCNETLPQIPSTLPGTKILISVNQLSLLTPVPEITEYDSSFFDIENSLCKNMTGKSNSDAHEKCKKTILAINEKNKELRVKILELDNKIIDINSKNHKEKNYLIQNNHECFGRLAIQLEKFKLQCNNLQFVHEDHLKQVESLNSLFRQENLQREHIEKQFIKITEEFQGYIKITEDKINLFQQEIQLKDKEIVLLKGLNNISQNLFENSYEKDTRAQNLELQLRSCIEKLEESEFQRKILQEKLKSVAEFRNKDLEDLLKTPTDQNEQKIIDLTQEVKKHKAKCTELENLLDDKYIEIKTNESEETFKSLLEYKNKYFELTEQTNSLKESLTQEKKNYACLLQQIREKNCKEIESKVKGADEKFLEYLKNYGFDKIFEKVSEGNFVYNNKKVSVAIKNGCLICKVGAGYIGIEKFLKNLIHEKEEVSPLAHKRSQTAAILKDKSPKEDSIIKAKEIRYNLTKINLNTKENSDEILKHPKTVSNRMLSHKEKYFTHSKDLFYKKVYK